MRDATAFRATGKHEPAYAGSHREYGSNGRTKAKDLEGATRQAPQSRRTDLARDEHLPAMRSAEGAASRLQ